MIGLKVDLLSSRAVQSVLPTLLDPVHLDVLEKLLVMWMSSQRTIVPVRRLLDKVDVQRLPNYQAVLLKGSVGGPRTLVHKSVASQRGCGAVWQGARVQD